MTVARIGAATTLGLGLALGAACGGLGPSALPSDRARSPAARSADVSVRVVRRPMGDIVALALWIDAGSLDGPNPTTMLVAAEVAAERGSRQGGRPVATAVVPDGTCLRLACPRADFERCMTALATSLAARDPSAAEFEVASSRVRARRLAGAGSRARAADALAVSAALGLRIEPLGTAEDQMDRDDVARVLAEHYGVERALLVVVGDLSEGDVESHLASFGRGVHAAAARARRSPESESIPRVVHEPAAGPARWTLAVRVDRPEEALGLAHAWSRRGALLGPVDTAAFPTRAGWVAMLGFDASRLDPQLALSWRDVTPDPPPPPREDAWAVADRIGAEWVADAPAPRGRRLAVAVVGEFDPERLEELTRSLDATASTRPTCSFEAVTDTTVTFVAWALPGPADERRADRGASAIAARVFAERCARDWDVRLVHGHVVALAQGADDRLVSSLEFARDCLRAIEPSERDVERARLEVIAATSLGDARRAAFASLAQPDAPGWIAPAPSVAELGRVAVDDVRARWRRWRSASWLGVVGPPVAAAWWNSTQDRSDSDALSETASRRGSVDTSHSASIRLPGLEARELLVGAWLDGCDAPEAASATLEWLVRRARAAGVSLTWRDHGVGGTLAWAAIAVRGADDALALVERQAAFGSAPALSRTWSARSAAGIARADPAQRAIELATARQPAPCSGEPQFVRAWLAPDPPSSRPATR